MPISRRSFLAVAAAAAVPASAADVPRPSPDFSINMLDGSKLALKSYRGKVVVMTFISTTCPHCQQVTQALVGIQKEYGPKGVQVLLSAMDPNPATVLPEFIRRFQPSYPVGYSPHAEALVYMQVSVVAPGFVPKMAILDRQGVIREQHGGEEPYFKTPEASIRNSLDVLLRPLPASKKRSGAGKP